MVPLHLVLHFSNSTTGCEASLLHRFDEQSHALESSFTSKTNELYLTGPLDPIESLLLPIYHEI